MPIAAPVSLGTNALFNFATNTFTITTTAAINSGDLAIVAVTIKESSLYTVSSVSDGTNNYVKANATNNGSNYDAEVWYKENAAAVTVGATITITLSAIGSGTGAISAVSAKIAGISPPPSLDSNRLSGNNSTSTSQLIVTAGAGSQNNEIIIGVESGYTTTGGTAPTYTQSAGFSSVNFVVATSGTKYLCLGMDYQIVSSVNSVSYGPNWSRNVSNIASLTSGYFEFNQVIPISSTIPKIYSAHGMIGY